jgi:hypothetical protein
MNTEKLAVTRVYTANGQQVRLQGHTDRDIQAHTKIFVQKKKPTSRVVDAKIIFKWTSWKFVWNLWTIGLGLASRSNGGFS